MQAKGHPLQDFDLVVQTFAEAVGFAVLPAVLDVAPPVADSAGDGVDLLHIGGGILFNPFCQFLVLDRVGPGSKDIVLFLFRFSRSRYGFPEADIQRITKESRR